MSAHGNQVQNQIPLLSNLILSHGIYEDFLVLKVKDDARSDLVMLGAIGRMQISGQVMSKKIGNNP